MEDKRQDIGGKRGHDSKDKTKKEGGGGG
jgi:hypothetical protein